jgi:hypothetical protein
MITSPKETRENYDRLVALYKAGGTPQEQEQRMLQIQQLAHDLKQSFHVSRPQ